ncbi:MAG: hypothetical protein LBV52_06130 [Spirochaetaceae bacterium]|nr:hypothetical protein [Spirochaetaceae bacterium]
MKEISIAKARGALILAVFAILGCENKFTSKTMDMIDPAPYTPPVTAIFWDTTEILLHPKFAPVGATSCRFLPIEINGVINNQDRKVWFAAMGGDANLLTFSPADWSTVVSATPAGAPDVKPYVTSPTTNVKLSLSNVKLDLQGSAAVNFKQGAFLGPDSNKLGSVSVTITVRKASDAEAGKLYVESGDAGKVTLNGPYSPTSAAIEALATHLISGSGFIEGSDWRSPTGDAFKRFFWPPSGTGTAGAITAADLLQLLSWDSEPIRDSSPHDYVVSFGPLDGIGTQREVLTPRTATVQLQVTTSFGP